MIGGAFVGDSNWEFAKTYPKVPGRVLGGFKLGGPHPVGAENRNRVSYGRSVFGIQPPVFFYTPHDTLRHMPHPLLREGKPIGVKTTSPMQRNAANQHIYVTPSDAVKTKSERVTTVQAPALS